MARSRRLVTLCARALPLPPTSARISGSPASSTMRTTAQTCQVPSRQRSLTRLRCALCLIISSSRLAHQPSVTYLSVSLLASSSRLSPSPPSLIVYFAYLVACLLLPESIALSRSLTLSYHRLRPCFHLQFEYVDLILLHFSGPRQDSKPAPTNACFEPDNKVNGTFYQCRIQSVSGGAASAQPRCRSGRRRDTPPSHHVKKRCVP